MVATQAQSTLEQVMANAAVDKTLTLVADMVGLSRGAVALLVEAGLPMMATSADADPAMFNALFAQSLKALPEPTPAFYTTLGQDPPAQQAQEAAFRSIFGPVAGALNREAARRAGTTEQQAGQVLAAMMPAVTKALGQQNTQRNEMGLGRLLRNLSA